LFICPSTWSLHLTASHGRGWLQRIAPRSAAPGERRTDMLLPDINIPAQCAAGLYPVTIQPTGRPCLPAGPIVHPKKLVMYSPATDDDGVGNMHSSSLFAFCFVLFGIFHPRIAPCFVLRAFVVFSRNIHRTLSPAYVHIIHRSMTCLPCLIRVSCGFAPHNQGGLYHQFVSSFILGFNPFAGCN